MSYSIEEGDVYWMPSQEYRDEHFHVVIVKSQNNSAEMLCVPLNSYDCLPRKLRDDSCVFEQKQIPALLTRRTQVTYKNSIIITQAELEDLLSEKKASFKCNVGLENLQRIRSKFMGAKPPRICIAFYSDYQMYKDLDL